MRLGIGYDVHKLAGRPLILGGVTIPYALGLLGHSDAMYCCMRYGCHVGSTGSGDIGSHFPDAALPTKVFQSAAAAAGGTAQCEQDIRCQY